MADRIDHALRWLASEFSASRDEFRQAQHPGGDMLLTGLVNNGYVRAQGDRVAVSEQGRRRLNERLPHEVEA